MNSRKDMNFIWYTFLSNYLADTIFVSTFVPKETIVNLLTKIYPGGITNDYNN
jgi:hypothetical protein